MIWHSSKSTVLRSLRWTKMSCFRWRSTSVSTANSVLESIFPEKRGLSHQQWHDFSIEEPGSFWAGVCGHQLSLRSPFSRAMECEMSEGSFRWFVDAKLNASENCLDRHVAYDPHRVALIWERDEPGSHQEVSYKELLEETCRLANVLLGLGVGRGDVVAIYLPVSPLAVSAMLACARIGAVHSVIFAGFSSEAIASRVQDARAKVIITAEESWRGGKPINLGLNVSNALPSCPSVHTVLVSRSTEQKRSGSLSSESKQVIDVAKAMQEEKTECRAEAMDAEDLLFILYTSGSTGKPKGLAHSTAGYLTYASFTHKVVFDYKVGDIFGCVADVGWITGHSYVVYGPLVNGGTSVLFESTPTYPDPGRYWETISRLGITHFYGAPTAIRQLLRHSDSYVTSHDRSSLKKLGSVGEPINHEAWSWLNDVVGEGRCDLVDTWWQTETGGVCLAPRPSEIKAPILAGKPMRPMFGIKPVLFDDHGKKIEHSDEAFGALCITQPWPGMARSVYGDHQRFVDTYFAPYPGAYFTGDGGHRDALGYWQITGRMDDVINVTGHRLGTAEVEDAIDEHEDVAEAAVVGFPHDMKGEGVYAYVILKDEIHDHDATHMREALKKLVRKQIAAYAVPDHIQFCSGLPKTRSGKIMRRILRKVAADQHEDLGDISTLANPEVVQEIVDNHNRLEKANRQY